MSDYNLQDHLRYRYLVSIVVDSLPEHYLKAELLLFTLNQFAKIPASNILVQCVDRVDAFFVHFIQENGYQTRTIVPYLDGAYCNKLQQLVGLEEIIKHLDGVFLLDIDMVVYGPLEPPVMAAVCGKIVDGPNPPLPVLERIFAAAGVRPPNYMPCDWDTGLTMATNWNGGFLYIPARLAITVSTQWRHWGQWLFKHPDLFDQPQQRIHTDQIAMTLTLASGSIPLASVPANLNFPIHRNRLPRTFDPTDSLRVLHYHDGLNEFGLIQPTLQGCPPVDETVERINAAIAAQRVFRFFNGYKQDRAMKASHGVIQTQATVQNLLQELGLSNDKSCRLILHTGTPKTGSSSLQYCLEKNRNWLHNRGILYPHAGGTVKPGQHQWLVGCLLAANETMFCQRLRTDFQAMDVNTHTVFLSHEGLYNHWWDFSPAAKSLLASLMQGFKVEIWVWFRDPESFANSYYRQNLANPQIERIPVYGQDLSFEEMLDDPWFTRHLDYLGFVREVQHIFGATSVRLMRYDGNIIEMAATLLGIKTWPHCELVRENAGFGQAGVDLTRCLNRYHLSAAKKAEAMHSIMKLDRLLDGPRKSFKLPEQGLRRVQQLVALGGTVLESELYPPPI